MHPDPRLVRQPCQLPSTGGVVVTVRAFCTAALSEMGASNCRMIGAATPTVCPSDSWNWLLTTTFGLMVLMAPVTAVALPSRPTTDPAQVYVAVAQRFDDDELGAVPVEHAGDGFSVGIGQCDPLEPAVGDGDAHRRGRQHVFGGGLGVNVNVSAGGGAASSFLVTPPTHAASAPGRRHPGPARPMPGAR